MKFREKDFGEIDRVSRIIHFVDKMDVKYADKESDEVFQKQPFIISLVLGYGIDLNPKEHEEVIKVLFIIWEYFKVNEKIGTKKVTVKQYDRIAKRNLQMLKYYESETLEADKSMVIESDLSHLNSKALLTAIIFRF
jgi:hypothetical protein